VKVLDTFNTDFDVGNLQLSVENCNFLPPSCLLPETLETDDAAAQSRSTVMLNAALLSTDAWRHLGIHYENQHAPAAQLYFTTDRTE